ncbi:hypothetical protein Misp01_37460 [Microtetraspora sp. NBRC 13810]|nr:hypothetical protein Misp01_37460 [Microtetraspora sp. NBRC 13810]
MVEPESPGLAVAGDAGGDVDEQAFLLVWGEPHGRTLRTGCFPDVATPCRKCFRVGKAVRTPVRPGCVARVRIRQKPINGCDSVGKPHDVTFAADSSCGGRNCKEAR